MTWIQKIGTKQEPALRPTEDVPVERDLNGDGFFNDGHDDKKSGKTILIHTGYNSETGSAGCQTIHKEDWNRFLESFPEDIANKNDIGYALGSSRRLAGKWGALCPPPSDILGSFSRLI